MEAGNRDYRYRIHHSLLGVRQGSEQERCLPRDGRSGHRGHYSGGNVFFRFAQSNHDRETHDNGARQSESFGNQLD
jgi:hypothetical protein